MAANARPYRGFMSPFMHRQFGYVMGLTLAICYIYAMWQGQFNSWIWMWFAAGIRALLLFIGFLFTLCLTMGHTHSGERTNPSELQTFTQYLYSFSAVSTFVCYGASAFWFGMVYIVSQPEKSNLGIVDPGKTYERSRLNERPLYLYTMLLQLSVVQAGFHLYRDYGRLRLPLNNPASADGVPPRSRQAALKQSLLPILHDSISRVGLFLIFGNVTYFLFFRRMVWCVGFPFAKARDSTIYGYKPRPGFNPFELTGRLAIEGFMLTYLWEFTHTAMSIYFSKEPVKKDKEHKPIPITNDSKDPNGSLLSGLRAKKDLVRSYAFWELAIISQRFPDRRATIYKEIDTKTFKAVLEACLTEITAVKDRIEAVSAPPPPPPPTEQEMAQQRLQLGYAHKPLISEPLKSDDIFAPVDAPAGRAATQFRRAKDFARSQGNHAGPHPFAPLVQQDLPRLIEHTTQKLPPVSALHASLQQLLRSPIFGPPFRQTFSRRAAAVALGSPHSRAATVVNAVTALTQLALRSIAEDVYGVVNRDVVAIIRTFAAVLAALDGFVKAGLDPHWTDVAFDPERSRRYENLGEVGAVAGALRTGLVEVLAVFETYLRGMEMSEKELREARELVAAVRVGGE
ncbi:nuclear envelope protein [Diplodia corticola]|uniref:Nuclear envelope protein n=1 Tax=Diplodia corticola TaxID=236234 RepID=A0A1J9QIP7_9PEZI|nr:nuclear envelope protein [Diplodia corticola]OJD28726.1 nuclear envelope protein [Diplodia corticola]